MNNTLQTLTQILTLSVMLGVISMPVRSQDGKGLSLQVQPAPLDATPFSFPPYQEFTLDNGLHVFVVENHQVPTVTFSLILRGGEAQDPKGKSGTASMMVDMLSKGTSKRTAQQTAAALDGVGASISGSAVGESISINGSALKKHSDLLFTILGEQLTSAAFDAGEIEKLREQYLASVASQKSDAQETAEALSRKVLYGFNNPIGDRPTEASVKAISTSDIVSFYNTYLIPNMASIAVVGDVTSAEVKKMLTKHLAQWKKKAEPDISLPEQIVAEAGVYFVPREGSVQSAVVIGAAIPGLSDPDHLPLNVTASYFGSSFGSILFETLRETYSYTYSPYGYVTRGGKYNRLSTGAEVRSSVTDSAITVILTELNRIGSEGPDPDKLERRIALMAGQYRLAFERASTVAAILQNAWRTQMPLDLATTYDQRLESVGYNDVQRVARKYFSPFDLRIVVVGAPEVRATLEQFGPVYDFTQDLEPAAASVLEEVDMTVEELVAAHRKALGGDAAVSAVKSVVISGTASMKMQGRTMNGTFERKLMIPAKEFAQVDLGMMKQAQWFDGTRGWISLNGGDVGEMPADELAKVAADARIFPGLALTEKGYRAQVLGKKNGQILVKAQVPSGSEQTYVFDAGTMLLAQIEKKEQTPQGPITNIEKFSDYAAVSGVQFPQQLVTQNPIYSLTYSVTTVVNKSVADEDFAPSGK